MECMWQRESCQSVTFDPSTETCIGYNTIFTSKTGGSANANTLYYVTVGTISPTILQELLSLSLDPPLIYVIANLKALCFTTDKTECDEPPDVNNASATNGSTRVGSMRMYECYHNHIMIGDSYTTCLSNGNWSSPNFTCAACGNPPTVSRTIVSQVGSQFYYHCDHGYAQNGSVVSTTCQSDGQFTSVDITCNDCNTYASNFTVIRNMYFNPPGFRPSHSGLTITLTFCLDECIRDNDCAAVYWRSSTNYCALQPRRVHDSTNYPQYYTTNSAFDEHIKNCID
ncbi:CUB and sushi domain-containing protein 1-like [Argopecten irradians]|uniref:CUB and sushi domain-containing protein 1-like n=1 Tax=Argopecten irradians TaxID=31199 RepID=UPI003722F52E